jgi:hypothetical protein
VTTNSLPPAHPPAAHAAGNECRAAAQEWLYAAARHRHVAADEWQQHGFALLTAGIMWDAVRVPPRILDPSLETDSEPGRVRRLLHELKLFGPVFSDPYRPFLYFLVPPGTDRTWPRTFVKANVACLGGTPPYVHHVGVPRIDRIAPPCQFWMTPPDGTGRSVDPANLYRVLRTQADKARAGGQ